jgi:hypothetical protein
MIKNKSGILQPLYDPFLENYTQLLIYLWVFTLIIIGTSFFIVFKENNPNLQILNIDNSFKLPFLLIWLLVSIAIILLIESSKDSFGNYDFKHGSYRLEIIFFLILIFIVLTILYLSIG